MVVVTPLGKFELFKIIFDKKDGSIYVPFPYLTTKRGLLAEVDPAASADPKVLDLKAGIVVDYDVKFAHHASGVVHFSKSGKHDLFPRRKSYPLKDAIGRLFEFHFYWLAGFAMLSSKEEVSDAQITLQFETHPTSLCVAVEWRRKQSVLDNTETPSTRIGPRAEVIRRSDGARLRFLLLGQPRGYPLQDHLIFISVSEIAAAQGADKPTAIFFGG